jgi:hypothetical protein
MSPTGAGGHREDGPGNRRQGHGGRIPGARRTSGGRLPFRPGNSRAAKVFKGRRLPFCGGPFPRQAGRAQGRRAGPAQSPQAPWPRGRWEKAARPVPAPGQVPDPFQQGAQGNQHPAADADVGDLLPPHHGVEGRAAHPQKLRRLGDGQQPQRLPRAPLLPTVKKVRLGPFGFASHYKRSRGEGRPGAGPGMGPPPALSGRPFQPGHSRRKCWTSPFIL